MKTDTQMAEQGRRIHDHYAAAAARMIAAAREADWYDLSFIMRVSQVQKRKAIGGRVAKIGMY